MTEKSLPSHVEALRRRAKKPLAVGLAASALLLTGCGGGSESLEQEVTPTIDVAEQYVGPDTYMGICGRKEESIKRIECAELPREAIVDFDPEVQKKLDEDIDVKAVEIGSIRNGTHNTNKLSEPYRTTFEYILQDPIVKKANEKAPIIIEQTDSNFDIEPMYDIHSTKAIKFQFFKENPDRPEMKYIDEGDFQKYYNYYPTAGALAAYVCHESVHALQDQMGETIHTPLLEETYISMLSESLEGVRRTIYVGDKLDNLRQAYVTEHRAKRMSKVHFKRYMAAVDTLENALFETHGLDILIAKNKSNELVYSRPAYFIAHYECPSNDTVYPDFSDATIGKIGELSDDFSEALGEELDSITEYNAMEGLSSNRLGHPWDDSWEMAASIVANAQTAPKTLVDNLQTAPEYQKEAVIKTLQQFGGDLKDYDKTTYETSNIPLVLAALTRG